MKKVQINRENILNPEEAFRTYLSKLMPIYIEDYGYENKSLIKERINKTLYVFDSLPVDEINFVAEYGAELQCREKARQAFDECTDFLKKKEIIEAMTEKRFYNILADAFGVGDRYIDELFTIDIDSYGLNMQLALGADNVSEEFKDEIRLRQEKYRKDCERLGIRCITDHRVIEKLFELRDGNDYETNLLLAKNTMFVKRVKKEIFKKSGVILDDVQLVDLLFYNKTGAFSVKDIDRKDKLHICYLPLAKNIMLGGVDFGFFHEIRHVIEGSDTGTGIHVFRCDKYLAMNEIRTEKNALFDAEKLKDFPLFSNDGFLNGIWSSYQDAFYYTEGFFENNREVLNKLAIKNDIKNFERFYGRKNLRLFGEYLKNVLDAFDDESWLYKEICDEEKQKSLVRSLNERCQSRHESKNLI